MLRPTAEALERLDDFRATGVADLGAAHLRREGRAGVLELRNPRHLNAEDDARSPPTEVAVDLALLDPEIEIGVFRGGVVEHPRYAGRRIFGAGINLTLLYRGRVSYLLLHGPRPRLRQQALPRAERETARRAEARSCGSPRSRPTRSAAPASSCT